MTGSGLLVRLEARPGKDREVEQFLRSAVSLVEEEIGTTAWFALRFGRGEYGVFDAFLDDAARQEHLAGPVALALQEHSQDLFNTPPRLQPVQILANKMPVTHAVPDTKGILLTFKAKPGHEQQVESFLLDARRVVMEEEPNTTAWFALRTQDGEYGMFDVFPDNGARFVHLVGHVPRELAKHAMTLLGSVPEVEMVNVQAEKLGA
jgi:quinol monooxygenase YgiN